MNTPDPELITALKRDEGLVLTAYPDPLSPLARWVADVKGRTLASPHRPKGLSGAPWTIGYGHTGPEVHEGLTWTKEEALSALIRDVAIHNDLLSRVLPWSNALDPVRRRVLQNMIFNMGWDNPRTPALEGFAQFVKTLAAIKAGKYETAAAGMLVSLWARQVGARAKRLSEAMRTGVEAA